MNSQSSRRTAAFTAVVIVLNLDRTTAIGWVAAHSTITQQITTGIRRAKTRNGRGAAETVVQEKPLKVF